MAEQVRRFRVKENGRWDVQAGDVGEYANNGVGAGCYWLKNAKWSGDGVWHFEPHEIEELPTFAVGDAVRVKAGGECSPYVGKKLIITKVTTDFVYFGAGGWLPGRFEPWNDAEEWDGTAWVAKKVVCPMSDSTSKPAIVCLREDGKIRYGTITPFDSTNEAFRKAEEWAALYPGKEYVVLQEKGSKRVERPRHPEFPVGAFVRAKHNGLSWGKDEKFVAGQVFQVAPHASPAANFCASPTPTSPRGTCLAKVDFELV